MGCLSFASGAAPGAGAGVMPLTGAGACPAVALTPPAAAPADGLLTEASAAIPDEATSAGATGAEPLSGPSTEMGAPGAPAGVADPPCAAPVCAEADPAACLESESPPAPASGADPVTGPAAVAAWAAPERLEGSSAEPVLLSTAVFLAAGLSPAPSAPASTPASSRVRFMGSETGVRSCTR